MVLKRVSFTYMKKRNTFYTGCVVRHGSNFFKRIFPIRCKIVAKNRELQKIFEIFIEKPQYVQFGK
jgi:hypothetical protein